MVTRRAVGVTKPVDRLQLSTAAAPPTLPPVPTSVRSALAGHGFQVIRLIAIKHPNRSKHLNQYDGNKSLYLVFVGVVFLSIGLLLEQLGQQHLGCFVRTAGQQHLDCF
jgi:hypothetical protein